MGRFKRRPKNPRRMMKSFQLSAVSGLLRRRFAPPTPQPDNTPFSLEGKAAHRVLVLDEQYASGARHVALDFFSRRLLRRDIVPVLDLMAGQIDPEHGALAGRAIDENVAARLLHDAVDRGEAEPGPLAHTLCREERLEDLLLDLERHAVACVLDLDQYILAERQALALEPLAFTLPDIARADRQQAAVRHCVARIHGEVNHPLVELRGIGLHV